MTLQQLKYVVALDDFRHFVKAAQHCFVTQPTLTLQVKKLEEELNLVLFDRSVQPFVPTPLGERFIRKARQILMDVYNLKNMILEEQESLQGNFRLGIIPTLAPYLLPLFVHKFSEAFPNIHLEIHELTTQDILDGLHNTHLDMGIAVTPLMENNLREIPVFYEPFLVFASPEHPLTHLSIIQSKDIVQEGLWLLKQGHCFRDQVLNICDLDKEQPNSGYSFESGSIETLKNMVRNNQGYTLIPELSANEKIEKTYLRRFQEPEPVREVSLIVHQNFYKEQLLHELHGYIQKVIPKKFHRSQKRALISWR
ncbi:MAG: hydrogen peroxide-inducible genes activator [Bacteroidota bacterium]